MFRVTKRITSGTLRGMTVVETTRVRFFEGEVCEGGPWTGPGYVVELVEELAA